MLGAKESLLRKLVITYSWVVVAVVVFQPVNLSVYFELNYDRIVSRSVEAIVQNYYCLYCYIYYTTWLELSTLAKHHLSMAIKVLAILCALSQLQRDDIWDTRQSSSSLM